LDKRADSRQGFPYYTQAAEIGSGPASANSSSPHNSDAEEAAAFHPYDIPAPLTLAAQDPLGTYQAPQHELYAPDWNAFNSATLAPVPPSVDPLDPLSAPPPSTTAQPGSTRFEHFAYPPLPSSGPPSECGDVDEHADPSSYVSQSPVHPPTFPVRPQPHMPLSLNMQYVAPSSAPGSAASYDYSHVHALDYAQPQHQYSPAASSTTSPMVGNLNVVDQLSRFNLDMSMGPPTASPVRNAASPVVYHLPHSQGMMPPPGHHVQHSPHIQQHIIPHPHSQPIPHSHHMHSHSHSQVMEPFHEPLIQSGGEQQQWGEWTHPDPFRQAQETVGETRSSSAQASLDPLTAGGSVIVDTYRG